MNPIIKAALRDVNVLRAAFGMLPLRSFPKGVVGNTSSCPIARALNAIHVSGGGFRKNSNVFKMPRSIARFIYAFDSRRYPRLIDRS